MRIIRNLTNRSINCGCSQRNSRKSAALLALFVVLAAVSAATLTARAQKGGDNDSTAPNSGGAGLSTGLISLAPGQSARIAVVNVGGKDIQGEFIFVPVTEEGKAEGPIPCNWIVSSGNAWSDKFAPGGPSAIQFYAQVRVHQDDFLRDLVPSLEIIDGTGMSQQLLSGSDFVSFRPIFNPPF